MTARTASLPTAAERSDAVFKTFVEAALLIVISVAHLAVGFSTGGMILAMLVLVAASLAADAYLFDSIGRSYATRRTLHFKASPFVAAAVLLFFVLPIENEGDKIVRFTLAAGIGGVITGLLNLGGPSEADA